MPGWYKGWFCGDIPGWHILQYYCSGRSNYIYVYVNPYRIRDYGNVVYKPPSYPEPTPMPEYPAPMPFSKYRDVSGPFIEPPNIQTSAYSTTKL
jgi:hypothetical protein